MRYLDEQQKWLIAAFAAIFVLLCSTQWHQPAIEDEILHHRCKVVWLEKGADWCELAHTPLYHEATSLWQRVWGKADRDKPGSIAILRSFGVFTSLLTLLILVWGLTSRRPNAGTLAAHPALVSALLVLHPYFIQYSLQLDYDSTVLIPPLLLAAILIERWDQLKTPHWRSTLAIAATFAIALFAKELTPLILIALWPLWALLRKWRSADKRWQNHVLHALVGACVALILFLGLMVLWGKWRGFNWYDPLLLTRDKFFNRSGDGGEFFPWRKWGWARFLFLTYIPILWIGFPLLYFFSRTTARTLRSLGPARLPFSLWSALGIFGAYTWLVQAGFYFPKYSQPAWPLLLLGASNLAAFAPAGKPRVEPRLIALFLALFLLGQMPFFDPLMIVEHRTELTAINLARHFFAIAAPLTALGLIARISPKQAPQNLLLAILCLFIGTDLGHSVSKHQTRYLYGEYGFNETVAEMRALKARVSPDEPVLSIARDIDWSLGKDSRYFEVSNYTPGKYSWNTRIIVSRTYSPYSIAGNPSARAEIERKFPCHRASPQPGGRYEWWWKPKEGRTCE